MRVGGGFLAAGLAALAMTAAACGAAADDDSEQSWQIVQQDLPGALLSVWGTSASDVWAVGADARDGTGPEVLHFDGASWQRADTGQPQGDLWWVYGTGPGDPIYMGGSGGVVLRTDDGATFTPVTTPGNDTVFGIWGAAADDVWAVGGAEGGANGGFAWRSSGGDFSMADGFPGDIADQSAVWKIYGRSAGDAWMVGTNGLTVRWDGQSLTEGNAGVSESLFTVHANADRYAAVGGFGSGIILENDGGPDWANVTPDPPPPAFSGVCLGQGDTGYAVGQFGAVYQRDASGWSEVDLGFTLDQSLHAVWIDPSGGVWSVGGQTLNRPLTNGVMIHMGDEVASGGI